MLGVLTIVLLVLVLAGLFFPFRSGSNKCVPLGGADTPGVCRAGLSGRAAVGVGPQQCPCRVLRPHVGTILGLTLSGACCRGNWVLGQVVDRGGGV
jgi:hypothetical protein